MNKLSTARINPDSRRSENLLDCIRAMRVQVGDGLNDEEFTRLLRQTDLPDESGFAFLSYCERFAMLSVPQQEPANWYPEAGWILPAKKKIAAGIADKYGLSLCEPPDLRDPSREAANAHHHFELIDRREAIIIIHPQFLKIRLFVLAGHNLNARTAQKPLLLGPELLKDLSALYKD